MCFSSTSYGLDGTLFRFPLRTSQQAKTSRISSYAYTHQEVATLMRAFLNESASMLLFLKHIYKMEMYVWPPNGADKPGKDMCGVICGYVS